MGGQDRRFTVETYFTHRVRLELCLVIIGFAVGLLAALLFSTQSVSAHLGCPTVAAQFGGPGNDTLEGDGGDDPSHDHRDTLDGGSGSDVLKGYTCGDTLYGRAGADDIHGGYGMDDLFGGDGPDNQLNGAELVGGNGDDYGEGGQGPDTLRSNSNEPDQDNFLGGDDNYTVAVQDTDVQDTATGGAGNDDVCIIDHQQGTGNEDNLGGGCEQVFRN